MQATSCMKSLAVVCCAVASALFAVPGRAQDAKPAASKSFDPNYIAAANAKATFLDAEVSCFSCHQANESQLETYRRRGSLNRVPLIETKKWEAHDFHAQAAHALTTPRAKAMGDLLGYDVAKSTQCLNCHSGQHKIAERKAGEPVSSPPTLTAPREDLVKYGVSCQACHGPASVWNPVHNGAEEQNKDWWKQPSEVKHAVGLLDVRHPRTRAQVCLSCHVGSGAEGKIITHDMYAAGHPPLGNFELETFIAGMPYHGLLIEDKTKSSPDSHKDWHRSDDFYRTRSVLTASIVALRMQVQLVLDEATWASAAAVPAGATNSATAGAAYQPHWPELAHFNCASCHHELAVDRRAPDRSASAPPGRPMLRSWPTALYEAAMQGSGLDTVDGKKTEPLLKPLEVALGRNPFGRPREVREAAQAVATRLDQELAAFEARPIDRAAAVKYLEAICAVGLAKPVDYEEARQLAWGAKAIVAELKKSGGAEADVATAARLETATAAFDTDLSLTLPQKPLPEAKVWDAKSYRPNILEAGGKSLDAALKFDDAVFRRRLENLKSALSPKS